VKVKLGKPGTAQCMQENLSRRTSYSPVTALCQVQFGVPHGVGLGGRYALYWVLSILSASALQVTTWVSVKLVVIFRGVWSIKSCLLGVIT